MRTSCTKILGLFIVFFGFLTATCSSASSSLRSQSIDGIPQPASGVPGPWAMILDEEFDGDSLNLSLWWPNWFGSNSTSITKPVNAYEQECYDPSQITVGGGVMNITAIEKSCDGYNYTSGLINTNGRFEFTFGYFEARIWLPGNSDDVPSDWPAFWADGQDWPEDGEIDVLEGLDGELCYHFHYTGGGPGGCTSVVGSTSGWHTYAAYWQPENITYYYDTTLVGNISSGVTSQPMYLIVDFAISNTVSPPIIVPATLSVDYIRVWQITNATSSSTATVSTSSSVTSTASSASTGYENFIVAAMLIWNFLTRI